MAENQGGRRFGGNGSNRGPQRRSGAGNGGSRSGGQRGGSGARGGKFGARRGNSGGNSGGKFGGYRSDRRREDGEERRFDRGERRNDRRDGERRFERRDGEKRFDRRDDRRDNRRDGERRNPRYERDDRRDDRRENRRFDENRPNREERPFEGRADGRGDRRSFSNQRGNHQGRQSSANYDKPRRNSDGTLSFPSQNPYTDRRPGEPKMPKGLEWSMLSKDEKERLRGLSKEHAENIGLHMLAAYALEEDDPDLAMEHAQWVARQASRVDVTRETLAFVAYRQGNYKLALREFRTAFRMNGYGDYLPFMADCERGLGNPQKAVDIALSDDAKQLRGEAKAELFLVYAGALADLDLFDKAVEIVHTIAHAKGVGGAYRMRAVQAEQNFLELAGRGEEAEALNDLLDRLEDQYADEDELDEDEVYVDNDLEVVDEAMLEGLGIDPAEMSAYLDAQQPEETEESEKFKESKESEDESQTEEPQAEEAEAEETKTEETEEEKTEE